MRRKHVVAVHKVVERNRRSRVISHLPRVHRSRVNVMDKWISTGGSTNVIKAAGAAPQVVVKAGGGGIEVL